MTRTAGWGDTPAGVVVTLRGEIDYANVVEVTTVVDELFAQRRPARLRVDVGELLFIDSTGLSALISLYRAALAAGSELVLVDPTPFLVTLLQVTGLAELFPIETTGGPIESAGDPIEAVGGPTESAGGPIEAVGGPVQGPADPVHPATVPEPLG